jgi:hypothetical protein
MNELITGIGEMLSKVHSTRVLSKVNGPLFDHQLELLMQCITKQLCTPSAGSR